MHLHNKLLAMTLKIQFNSLFLQLLLTLGTSYNSDCIQNILSCCLYFCFCYKSKRIKIF